MRALKESFKVELKLLLLLGHLCMGNIYLEDAEMRRMDRNVNYIFLIKHFSWKEPKSFEKANIMKLPAGFSYERKGHWES